MPPFDGEEAVLHVDQVLLAWFPQALTIAERKSYTEGDLRDISNALTSAGRASWSRVPRIYATLRIINQLPAIDSFIEQGLTDFWFPFTHKTLPESLRSQTARNDFIEAQRLVLTKALDLEKEDGKHRHFSRPQDIPLVKVSELGRGGFGVVEKVLSTVSQREYARKLIPRGPNFRKNKEVLQHFESELTMLKKLSHPHIVELIGSYTDPRYVGILMSPVAECNLKEYLDLPLTSDRSSLLRTSFGCLVAAVNYLHQERIRHKDIKPQNILVKGHHVYITDFGISRDWTDLGHSTTTGPTTKTPRYCAPEVAANLPRNSLADMWSLGCVFLEVWSVLCGKRVLDLSDYLKKLGANLAQPTCYHGNIPAVQSWCALLYDQTTDVDLRRPNTWIAMMLESDLNRRCNAQMLLDKIQESCYEEDSRYAFIGICCTEHDDSAESVQSSIFEPELGDYTTEATTTSSGVESTAEGANKPTSPVPRAGDMTPSVVTTVRHAPSSSMSPKPSASSRLGEVFATPTGSAAISKETVYETGIQLKADGSHFEPNKDFVPGGDVPIVKVESQEALEPNVNVETTPIVDPDNMAGDHLDLPRSLTIRRKPAVPPKRFTKNEIMGLYSRSTPSLETQTARRLSDATQTANHAEKVIVQPEARMVHPHRFGDLWSPPDKVFPSWIISYALKQKYKTLYNSATQGYTEFAEAHTLTNIFHRSGLPESDLEKIWDVVDQSNRGTLNLWEFECAMHLIYNRLYGIPVPDKLPQDLYIDGSEAGYLGRLDTAPSKSAPPEINAMPPPGPPEDKHETLKATQASWRLPESRQDYDWTVTSPNWKRYEYIFSHTSSPSDYGFESVDADRAKSLCRDKVLQDLTLKQIWELLGLEPSSTLNRNQFIVMMRLAEGFSDNQELPMHLPPELQTELSRPLLSRPLGPGPGSEYPPPEPRTIKGGNQSPQSADDNSHIYRQNAPVYMSASQKLYSGAATANAVEFSQTFEDKNRRQFSFISAADQKRYEVLFRSVIEGHRTMPRRMVLEKFRRLGLSSADAAIAWDQVRARDNDGLLLPEFCLAMYLCEYVASQPGGLFTPLPASIYAEVGEAIDVNTRAPTPMFTPTSRESYARVSDAPAATMESDYALALRLQAEEDAKTGSSFAANTVAPESTYYPQTSKPAYASMPPPHEGSAVPVQITVEVEDSNSYPNSWKKQFELTLGDLHGYDFFDKLCNLAGVFTPRQKTYERYSVSTGSYEPIDPANGASMKQLYRAATARHELALKIIVLPPPTQAPDDYNRPPINTNPNDSSTLYMPPYVTPIDREEISSRPPIQLVPSDRVIAHVSFTHGSGPPALFEVHISYFPFPLPSDFYLLSLKEFIGERLDLNEASSSAWREPRFHLDWRPPWDGFVDMNGKNRMDYEQLCAYIAEGNHHINLCVELLGSDAAKAAEQSNREIERLNKEAEEVRAARKNLERVETTGPRQEATNWIKSKWTGFRSSRPPP